jgi:hypothetical protein
MINNRADESTTRADSEDRGLPEIDMCGVARMARSATAACLLLLGGCSLMNPYLRSDLLKCEQATADDASCTRPDVGHLGAVESPYVGEAASAIRAANDQRSLYVKEMGSQYWFNSAAGLGMIGLSADAIYKGLTSKSASSTRWVAAEGAAVAGLYGVDTWLHNKSTEAAYIVGFQAITCTLLRTRAILLPQEEYEKFDSDVAEFQEKIAVVDATLSELQIDVDFGDEVGKNLETGEKANLKREMGNVYATLAKSRKLLLTARSYEGEINISGQTIRNQVDLIIASVSSQLAQSEPNISALKGLVGTYSDPSKGISGLQAVAVAPSGSSVTPPSYESPANPSPSGDQSKGKDSEDQSKNTTGVPVHPEDYKQRQILRAKLWLEVSDLYASSRRINSVLDTAQHFYVSTKRISACDFGGGPPPLEVTPATVADPVSPGSVLKFSISGGIGIPEVALTGSTGSSAADAKTPDMVLSVNGNSLIATVTILPDASGTLTLQASDKGTPPQQAKVTMEVEKSSAPAKPTFKATPGDKTIGLSFSTPAAKGGTLTGYTVTLSTDSPASTVTLKFSSPKEGTKATGSATITGEISSDSGGNTAIDLAGLTNGQSYTAGLTATFGGASDVEYEAVANVKPAPPASPATKPSPPSIKTTTSSASAITVVFAAPANGGDPITGFTATATNTDKTKNQTLTGKSKGAQASVEVSKCTAGDQYAVTVVAINKIGSSPASKAASVTCVAEAATDFPPPTVVSVQTSANTFVVNLQAPKNPKTPVTGYTASAANATSKTGPLIGLSKGTEAKVVVPNCITGNYYAIAVVASYAKAKSVAVGSSTALACSK